jgi:hypothetical protein
LARQSNLNDTRFALLSTYPYKHATLFNIDAFLFILVEREKSEHLLTTSTVSGVVACGVLSRCGDVSSPPSTLFYPEANRCDFN